ncbi:MAG TPA: YdbH domain-containing protein [Micavibrio sp.]|jgi:hypothetical protein
MRYKIISGFVLAVVAIVALSVAFLPWKEPLGRKLQNILETKGFQNVRLTLSDIGLSSATLQNITIGDENPLMLKNLTLHYSAREIMKGNLRELAVSGLALEIRQQDGKWIVPGYSGSGAGKKFAVPVTPNEIAAIPFDRVKIEDSRVDIVMPAGRISLPVYLEWNRTEAIISMQAENPSFTGQKFSARAAHGEMNVKLNPSANWEGAWKFEDVQPETGDAELPLMNLNGTVKADATTITLDGRMIGTNDTRAAFALRHALDGSQGPVLTIASASMPWRGGRVALGKTTIPLTGKQPVRLTLKVEKISVDEFMQSLTGKRVSATGIVSGALPLVIGRDGGISFNTGELKTEGPGTISMPPELIPGDNEQVALTREILKNFHYDGLSLAIEKAEGDKISVLVATQGRNPDVLNGRPVKLNIRLNGDLLDLVRQNAMFLTEPQKILEQGRQ